MGSQIVAPMLGRQLLDHWLASDFMGGRSTAKVEKIKKLDQMKKGG
jgi:ribose 5-phosphate isomerase RpiB